MSRTSSSSRNVSQGRSQEQGYLEKQPQLQWLQDWKSRPRSRLQGQDLESRTHLEGQGQKVNG